MRIVNWVLRDVLGQLTTATARLNRHDARLTKLEKNLSDLSNAEKKVEASEANLEKRDAAHTQALKDINASLQKIIDANASGGDVAQVISDLQALSGRIDAFDPDAPASIAPVVGA